MADVLITGDRIEFDYTNWKGIKGHRKAEVRHMFFGSTEYHPQEQWLMAAWDYDKQDERIFAMDDMENVKFLGNS